MRAQYGKTLDRKKKKGKKNVKTKWLKFFVMLGMIILLVNCGGSNYVPAGSKSLGVYEGTHSGVRTNGAVRVYLFQAPDGTKKFEGNFTGEMIENAIFFRGTMADNAPVGEFSAIAGTVTGELSPDGSQMTGSYNITMPTMDNGTWKAEKKQ